MTSQSHIDIAEKQVPAKLKPIVGSSKQGFVGSGVKHSGALTCSCHQCLTEALAMPFSPGRPSVGLSLLAPGLVGRPGWWLRSRGRSHDGDRIPRPKPKPVASILKIRKPKPNPLAFQNHNLEAETEASGFQTSKVGSRSHWFWASKPKPKPNTKLEQRPTAATAHDFGRQVLSERRSQ